ncbi:MAG: hypothetical protein K2R93_08320 [Gemmatimonadaceae bacterium]|nr:hypothetical protein [Gemmatimonadaceae bacterium]
MRARLSSLVLLLSSGVVLAACSNLSGSEAQPNRYGALNVQARNNGTTAAVGLATMIFFKGVNVSVPNSSNNQFDQCIISRIDTTTSATTGMNSVGSGLALSIGARSVPMPYNSTTLRYESGANQVTYSSGESVTISVPDGGAVFPLSTLTLKLAEPIVPGPLTLPAANADWVVRWNGTGDGVSSIQLQLRYATSGSVSAPNEQVYCVLQDDGNVTIPASYLTGFLASPSALRSMRLLRWRTNERVIDANTLLHLTSTIDTVVTFP